MIDEPLLQDVWTGAIYVELGYLAQGYANTKGTDTINFMSLDEISNILADRTVTYARIVVDCREQEEEDPNRIHIMVEKNLIEYPYELTTCTADLTISKVMWNIVISTPKARHICADVNKF